MSGFWVRTSVKVELTKEEKCLIGRHSSPQWELDIVSYNGRGVPVERVSILLGDQSARITEKHYAPCVRARQEHLEADVRRT